MPDNRELATAILFAALVIGGLSISAVRRQVPSLLRIAGSLAGLFAIYLATSAALLWVAAQVGLWNTALWWPTGTIVFGVGIGLTAKAIQAKSGHNVWESVPAETVGVTVLIVLYSGLASLPLAWELILQMATALFASVAVVAASQNQAPVKRLCEFALITIGLVFVTTTTIELAHGMSAAQWKLLGQETLMSFWFPFALLPFLYLAAYYSSVEGAAVNVRIRRAKAVRKHPLIARLFIAFRLRIAWANGFDRVWAQRYAEADSRRARSRVLSHYRRTRIAKFRTRRWKRDDSVAQWDGRAMPRNARHIEELLASRPLGWEYLLFGATMWTAMLALEPRYKEYRHRVDRPQPDLDEQEPLERLHSGSSQLAV